MSKNLEKYGFTNFSENDAVKKKFLENVEEGMSTGAISIFPGAILPAPFPNNITLSPGFYSGEEVSEHESSFPKYHELIFPLMETIATTISLPETQGIIPPFIDPTIPIQAILIELSLPDLTTPQLEWVLQHAQDFIDAFSELPEKWKPLYELFIEIPDLNIDTKEVEKKIKELQEKLTLDIPKINLPPSFEIPSPPFIDIPEFAIPLLSLPNIGLIDFILQLINAAVAAVLYVIEVITSSIKKFVEFVKKVMQGIAALVEYLFELIFDFLSFIFEAFKDLLAQLGWISTISTIIKYVIGMIIVSIVAFTLGSGMIADAVAKFLNLN